MISVDRAIAEALIRVHMAEYGPLSSEAKLSEPLSSATLQEQMEQRGVEVGSDTLVSILSELASRDYITLAKASPTDPERIVTKIYPNRLKRDFNLWYVLEDE